MRWARNYCRYLQMNYRLIHYLTSIFLVHHNITMSSNSSNRWTTSSNQRPTPSTRRPPPPPIGPKPVKGKIDKMKDGIARYECTSLSAPSLNCSNTTADKDNRLVALLSVLFGWTILDRLSRIKVPSDRKTKATSRRFEESAVSNQGRF